jgi:hypothetical protein
VHSVTGQSIASMSVVSRTGPRPTLPNTIWLGLTSSHREHLTSCTCLRALLGIFGLLLRSGAINRQSEPEREKGFLAHFETTFKSKIQM